MLRYLLLLFAFVAGCSGSTPGPNRPPVAVAGPDRIVAMGGYALLDGTQSFDPDGDRLSYIWEVLAAPPGADAGADGMAEDDATLRARDALALLYRLAGGSAEKRAP